MRAPLWGLHRCMFYVYLTFWNSQGILEDFFRLRYRLYFIKRRGCVTPLPRPLTLLWTIERPISINKVIPRKALRHSPWDIYSWFYFACGDCEWVGKLVFMCVKNEIHHDLVIFAIEFFFIFIVLNYRPYSKNFEQKSSNFQFFRVKHVTVK